MTQDQANAIAEREYQIPELSVFSDRYASDAHVAALAHRQAYAKCLMDMNPLIEAGEKIANFCDDPDGSNQKETLAEGLSRLLPALRTALSNLTKNIEP